MKTTCTVQRLLPDAILAAALAIAALLPLSAQATPVWQQTDNLAASLDNNDTVTASGLSWTVAYTSQVATNTGASAEHMGMYLGWAWLYDAAGAATSLLWDNTSGAFEGGGASLAITGNTGLLSLTGIADDTYTDINPWSPDGSTPAIQTLSSWNVPFFDFGVLAAGASANYDITLTFTFADVDAFNKAQTFYIGGQGVQAVPEPGSFALAGLALLGLALRTRRPKA